MDPSELDITVAVLLVFRLFLGVFFLQAGIAKILHWPEFMAVIREYQLLSPAGISLVGVFVPLTELAVALLLLSDNFLPIASCLATLMLICFNLAMGVNLYRGRMINCHCFGIASRPTIGMGAIARNSILLLLSSVILIGSLISDKRAESFSYSGIRAGQLSSWLMSMLLIGLCLACCWIALLLVEWAVDIRVLVTGSDLRD